MKLFLLRSYLVVFHLIDLNLFYFGLKYIVGIDFFFDTQIPLIFKFLFLYLVYNMINWIIKKSELDQAFESLIEKELSKNDIQDRN